MRRIPDLYAKRTTGGCDAEVLVAEAPHEVEGFLRGLFLRETECVGLDLRLDGGTYLGCRAKVTVGRDIAVDALVRPLEVIMLDEEFEPPKAVRKIGEDRLGKKLLPERLPEPFDLSECLRMLRTALAVRDAAAPK